MSEKESYILTIEKGTKVSKDLKELFNPKTILAVLPNSDAGIETPGDTHGEKKPDSK